VNGGKFVVFTTHSDYIVAEISNLIAAKKVKPEAVAAYLAKAEGSHAAVERLAVDNTGIPEDEFAKVAEEILEERNELY
jgi:predicted ATPase